MKLTLANVQSSPVQFRLNSDLGYGGQFYLFYYADDSKTFQDLQHIHRE